ncbi:hypothetical protein CF68_24975, partial [Cupriavidus sp. SK-4]|uniref:hypothetical protein n=1 Tax=Cupriavidus sp. SK-4 TaxID=574750 RepID=UPI000445481C
MQPIKTVRVRLTPIEDRTPVKVLIAPPLLYFSIYYRDSEHSFRRASQTMERTLKARADWKLQTDKYVAIEVYTEAQFTDAWASIARAAREGNYVVAEGHLFTHASKPGGENSGLEFAAVPGTGDGTVNKAELTKLAVLPWRKSGMLFLHGCNTARTGEKRNWTPAELLANAQRIAASGTLGRCQEFCVLR